MESGIEESSPSPRVVSKKESHPYSAGELGHNINLILVSHTVPVEPLKTGRETSRSNSGKAKP